MGSLEMDAWPFAHWHGAPIKTPCGSDINIFIKKKSLLSNFKNNVSLDNDYEQLVPIN